MKKYERDENGNGWYTNVIKRDRGFDWINRVYLLDANGERVQNLDEKDEGFFRDVFENVVFSTEGTK